MTALSELRRKAREEYPGFDLEFDDGTTVTLRSVMDLKDEEYKQFQASHKKLEKADENDDIAVLRAEIVNILSGVSTNKAKTAEELEKEPFSTITVIFREYGETTGEAQKSTGDSGSPE